MKRQILKTWLRFLASKILVKYQPQIIAITGSTGKTSTKDAVFAVLDDGTGKVAKTWENLNTEFGVTANIIDPDFKGTQIEDKLRLSIGDVVHLIAKAIKSIVFKVSYPQVLILELAADRPGDIQYFMEFIKPEIGILTNIGDVHLEFFGNKTELVEEKSKLIGNVLEQGLAILNQDDEFSNLVSQRTLASKVLVSVKNPTDWQARDIGVSSSGIHFNVIHKNEQMSVSLPIYGQQFIYAILMALAVADYSSIPLQQAIKRLSNFKPAIARFERINLGNLTIIDDTYNANPTSTVAALQSLVRLGAQNRKVAILGDMRELGGAYEKGHKQVGELSSKTVELLITVGSGGELIGKVAVEAGLSPDRVINLGNMDIGSMGDVISKNLQDNDIVLIKGSRAVHMDKIVDLIKQRFSHE